VVTFEHALLQGLAPDGGLFIPTQIPKIDSRVLAEGKSLPELAALVLDAWLSEEIAFDKLFEIASSALDFPIPLIEMSGENNLKVLELFHGPTLSFKDVAARTMARLMAHFLAQNDQELTILVATSGDTGSAVADAFSGLDNIRVVVLYPAGKVSSLQEMQLTLARPNVHTLSVDGSFDDCQALVKEAFLNQLFESFNLSSANSINIGRLIPQSIYYHLLFRELEWEPINVIVPCGNLGNLTAGLLAAEMLEGFDPKFTAAHNLNDSLPRFLEGKEIEKTTYPTLSNAMDVSIPSNLERLTSLFGIDQLTNSLEAYSVTDQQTKEEIVFANDIFSYLVDPHTAVGLSVARKHIGNEVNRVVLSTAHPAKFPETIQITLGIDCTHSGLSKLEDLEHRSYQISNDIKQLHEFLYDHLS